MIFNKGRRSSKKQLEELTKQREQSHAAKAKLQGKVYDPPVAQSKSSHGPNYASGIIDEIYSFKKSSWDEIVEMKFTQSGNSAKVSYGTTNYYHFEETVASDTWGPFVVQKVDNSKYRFQYNTLQMIRDGGQRLAPEPPPTIYVGL